MSEGTIKVRVVVEVEVDRAKYDAEYGNKNSAADIREAVKGEVTSAAESAFAMIEAVTVVGFDGQR